MGDAEALAERMERLASSAEERSRLGEAARGFVRTVYAPEAMARQTLAVYRGILDEKVES